MDHITYLIGAGASANCLPIVNQIPDRLEKLIHYLENDLLTGAYTGSYHGLKKSKQDHQRMLIEDLKWLHNQSGRHISIDTFAKKLWLRGDEKELLKLKFATSVFFTCEQLLKKPDMRYDSFFASILQNNWKELPKNIKMLSWNYDTQFEIAYSEYSNETSIEQNQNLLGFKTTYKDNYSDIKDKFSIIKLNGGISYQNNALGDSQFLKAIKSQSGIIETDDLESIVINYIKGVYPDELSSSYPRSKSNLSFAWEMKNDALKKLLEPIKQTTILIIIGYSFPFFNREVDRKVISYMPDLKKVFFQSIDTKDVLTSRFRSISYKPINDVNMTKIEDINQFFLPPEL